MMTTTMMMTKMISCTNPALSKLAEELQHGIKPAKLYHPDVQDYFKKKLEKGRDSALEMLHEQNAKKPAATRS
jgi:hypothetical protein